MSTDEGRRPLRSRGTAWARGLAAALARAGVSPNAISLAGLALGLSGGAALVARGLVPVSDALAATLLVAGGAGNQLRLLCNLMDGLVAVEHGGGGSKMGDVYNELPDRVSDAAVAIGAGHAASALPGALELGYGLAVLSVLCAYVRALGASLGTGQVFAGPLSKPVRGALLSISCVAAAFFVTSDLDAQVLRGALALLCAGTALTVLRRTRLVARALRDA